MTHHYPHRHAHRDRRRRPLAVAAALVLAIVAASCGGDDDDSRSVVDPPAESTPVATAAAGDVASGDESEPAPEPQDVAEPSGVAGAVVTVGDEQFELPNEIVCVSLGGAVSGTFVDDSGVQASIDIPPEDWQTSSTGSWEAPSIELRDERDEMNYRVFEAGPDPAALYPDTDAAGAQIDAFTVAGSTATGSGAAIDTFAIQRANVEGSEFPVLVPVSFEATCS